MGLLYNVLGVIRAFFNVIEFQQFVPVKTQIESGAPVKIFCFDISCIHRELPALVLNQCRQVALVTCKACLSFDGIIDQLVIGGVTIEWSRWGITRFLKKPSSIAASVLRVSSHLKSALASLVGYKPVELLYKYEVEVYVSR